MGLEIKNDNLRAFLSLKLIFSSFDHLTNLFGTMMILWPREQHPIGFKSISTSLIKHIFGYGVNFNLRNTPFLHFFAKTSYLRPVLHTDVIYELMFMNYTMEAFAPGTFEASWSS